MAVPGGDGKPSGLHVAGSLRVRAIDSGGQVGCPGQCPGEFGQILSGGGEPTDLVVRQQVPHQSRAALCQAVSAARR